MSLEDSAAWPLEPPPGDAVDDADAILDRFLDYVKAKGLELYPAQEQAILELLDGKHVILKTPTGSGKSLVAAALHYDGLCRGLRTVYTSPIKALVNEKFLALCRDFGPDNVGMSTGDASVNQDAPVLCCTAEVLANIALRDGENAAIDAVVMDEFHYYSDRDRGVAWQVPLLTLPRTRFLLMSATLGETRFFERTLERLTGVEAVTVASHDRPVPLALSYAEKSLEELLPALHEEGKLPAYLVHFTQRGATETAQRLTSLNFCSKSEKEAIAAALAEIRFNSPFGKEFRKFLRHGIGVHHAGLLPKYRILVEKLAQQNKLKVICGTDTLGVGVNVPIRTVVFTSLCKYDGEKTRILAVRDFHQIAGRAGRKGFDDEGFVIAQAPEHVIENLKMERKAADNPKKAKKLVRRKPPERGYTHWDQSTFERLAASPPEPLVSSFKVSHGMLLNVLAREGDGCAAMRQIIRDCHEPPAARKKLFRRGWSLFRSLVDKDIVEILPARADTGAKVRVHADLQEDFSLNHALSLYLVDTVDRLDRDDPAYAELVLALVEAVLENPEAILRRQIDRLKDELVRQMKAEGIPYEERMERLENVEHPKPFRDFIYDSFNAFADAHPWVGQDNIRPKSIAGEMFERYMGFAEYVREYGLQRAEGLLLRHLSNTYKTLTQTVPDSHWNDDIEDRIVYLEQLVRGTDASILDEWEALRNPAHVPVDAKDDADTPPARPVRPLDPARDRPAFERLVRDAVFRFLRPLAARDYRSASTVLAELAGRPPEDAAPPPVVAVDDESALNEGRGLFPWHSEALAAAWEPWFERHEALRLDPAARARDKTHIAEDPLDGTWTVAQTLVDPEEANDTEIEFTADTPAIQATGQARLHFRGIRPWGE